MCGHGGLCPGAAGETAAAGQAGAGQSPPEGAGPAAVCHVCGGAGRPDPVPGGLLAAGALAGRPAGGAPPVSPLGRPPPHFTAGAPAGDPPGGAGAVGHVSGGGQRGHLFAGGIFPRPAGTKAPVVEGAGNGADRLGDQAVGSYSFRSSFLFMLSF